ncbi:pyruvate carboxylase [Colletotrichum spaethianum]|uniref:Pyruvate carboxylase n=1 Tax=Colletotrichum spaethianum TaxID=700344 RepID=A0AA37LBT3_9PEZI|nr:pyruvate carboxylase [Colletotrichum spaethianum]GKT44439.1 pyruvate carboxylase [Colletotrichum spaethianum]
MDPRGPFGHTPASAETSGLHPQGPDDAAADSPSPLRDRRREKPMLSCISCRSRKVRCDRQLPCKTCTNRGIGSSCTYKTAGPGKTKVSVGDRIQQLEERVRSLLRQQQQEQQTPQRPAVSPDSLVRDSLGHSLQASPGMPPQSVPTASLASVDEGTPRPAIKHASLSHSRDSANSPAPSDPGSMRLHSHDVGVNYVGSVHWAAVLDSISELRDHYEEEEEARMLATSDHTHDRNPGPRLLYQLVQATKDDILKSIPARPVVDRMVARYFNAQGVVPEILHSGHFLREYERFWQNPAGVPFIWIGLLFSVMCIATLYTQSIGEAVDLESLERLNLFREQTFHCLIRGQYTRGGDYVLETMINNLVCESFLSEDTEIGLWLVQGIIVQLALSQGYHRDPQNFQSIIPFAGEMRRRYDTEEPRNLLDTDFDDSTVELPPSRPETEVTPVLYSLAKNRIDKMMGLVYDLVNDTLERPYTEILDLDRKLQEVEATLPTIFRWKPLSESFMVPPQVVMHRVLLQLAIQRLVIWLHRRYLAPSYSQPHYEYSRRACVQAAIKILEFQQIVMEETQADGLLYPVQWARWMSTSSRPRAVFLLGVSILCYYVQLAKSQPEVPLDQETGTKILSLLRNTCPLWLHSPTVSREARRADEHLALVLGLREGQTTDEPVNISTTVTPQDTTSSLDQFTWDAYEGN